MINILASILIVSLVHPGAFAGNDRQNGGDAVKNRDGSVRFLDLVREPSAEVLDLEEFGFVALLAKILEAHRGLKEGTYYSPQGESRTVPMDVAILRALQRLEFYLVAGPIPDVDDRGVVTLPWNIKGKVVRLALQERASGRVAVDRDLFKAMDLNDRLAFFLHEGVIRLWYDDFYNEKLVSTADIANFVSAVFKPNSGLSPRAAARYLCNVGLTVSEKSHHQMQRMTGIFTRGTSYFSNLNVLFFRREKQCHAVELRPNGPLNGTLVTGELSRPYILRHDYSFIEVNHLTGETHLANIALTVDLLNYVEFWFESKNPASPLLAFCGYECAAQTRLLVYGR